LVKAQGQLYLYMSPPHDALSRCRWRISPLNMEGRCEYIK